MSAHILIIQILKLMRMLCKKVSDVTHTPNAVRYMYLLCVFNTLLPLSSLGSMHAS